MRAFCLVVVFLAACGSDTGPTAAPGDDDDPTLVGTGTESDRGMGSGGTGGGGGEGGVGGVSAGACANDGDIAVLGASVGARELARQCIDFPCIGESTNPERYESCIALCIASRLPDLSSGCSSCFAQVSRCELDNTCQAACRLNLCGDACRTCSSQAGCLDQLEDCTGLNDGSCDP